MRKAKKVTRTFEMKKAVVMVVNPATKEVSNIEVSCFADMDAVEYIKASRTDVLPVYEVSCEVYEELRVMNDEVFYQNSKAVER